MIFASRFLRLEDPPMQGPDVLALQEELKRIGLYPGEVDGSFGKVTQAAVIQFQLSISQPADGVVGPDTWNQLTLRTVHQPVVLGLTVYDLPSIYIDTVKRRLKFSSASLNKTYKVAVGKPTTPSPLGNWVVVQKALNPGGPFGVRWMRLSVPWGGYGIHGTNNPKSIGRAVSHGCIRMYNDDVIEVYDRTPIGTPVTIVGKSYADRNMKKGDSGSDVAQVQRMLKKLGYYKSKIDGYFGSFTEQAVKRFQADKALQADGIVGPRTIFELQKAYAIAQNHQQP
ncbi:protein erfk/srfk precursor [hydrocarbon metagenome]|uniref:Protein erfk/srfk n=1 Tax=hydrocarbon metagenome TaxID=938273 RepID=A0A0W8E2U2_9ZZZZ